MTAREKKLAITFGGLLAVFAVGGVVWKLPDLVGSGKSGSVGRQLEEVKAILKSKDLWEERALWMDGNIPAYSSESVASAKLLERVAKLTKLHGVKIESQEIIKIDPIQDSELGHDFHYNRTEMSVGLSGDIQRLVKCIHEIQTPEFFTGIDRLTLENSEDEGLKCTLLITQWYQTM
ncbi:MAG: GspMb/PilO family protein [Verrucomicrobiales bacterium]|nr:GspMb/PilO family protein [Verrucomicrobiales bacterium]